MDPVTHRTGGTRMKFRQRLEGVRGALFFDRHVVVEGAIIEVAFFFRRGDDGAAIKPAKPVNHAWRLR